MMKPTGPLPTTWIAFDLETTGLYPGPDGIIEIGAARFTRDGEVDSYSTLVRPHKSLPPIITKVTGLTDDDLADAPAIGDVLPKFIAYIGDDPLIAHNAPFDVGFVAQSLASEGMAMPRNPVVDTLEIARSLLRMMPNHQLQTLLAYYEIDPGNAHRALDDSRALALLFGRMLTDAGAEAWDAFTWEAFEKLAVTPLSIADALPALSPDMEPLATELEGAARERRDIRIRYRDTKGESSERTVSPKGIFPYNGRMQLVAHCHLRGDERQFRLDRIEILKDKAPAEEIQGSLF